MRKESNRTALRPRDIHYSEASGRQKERPRLAGLRVTPACARHVKPKPSRLRSLSIYNLALTPVSCHLPFILPFIVGRPVLAVSELNVRTRPRFSMLHDCQ